jgi:hypothetical protein
MEEAKRALRLWYAAMFPFELSERINTPEQKDRQFTEAPKG